MLYGFRIIKQTLCENSVPSVRGFGAIQKTPPRQVGAAFIAMLYLIIQQPFLQQEPRRRQLFCHANDGSSWLQISWHP